MGLAKELWGATKVCGRLGWLIVKFLIKNIPAALGMLWHIKKETSLALANEYAEAEKRKKIEALNSEINLIALQKKNKNISTEMANKKLINTMGAQNEK